MSHKYDIFLSYNIADREWAAELAKSIKNDKKGRPLQVFIDTWHMELGDDVPQTLEKAIKSSKYIGFILSPASVKSNWVNFERSMAVYRDIETKKNTIIPIIKEDCQVTYDLGRLNSIDFSNDKDYEAALSKLVAQLRREPPPQDVSEEKEKNNFVEDFDALHEQTIKRYMEKSYQKDIMECSDTFFERYLSLFNYLVPGMENFSFNVLFDLIINSAKPYALQINGLAGSGKSSLLSLLYLYVYKKLKKEGFSNQVPFYINLHYYYRLKGYGKDYLTMAKKKLTEDLKPLSEFTKRSNKLEVIFLIDGIDEYVRSQVRLDKELYDFIESFRLKRKVIGIGQPKIDNIYRSKSRFSIKQFGDPENVIELQGLHVNDKNCKKFIAAFSHICSEYNNIDTEDIYEHICEKIQDFKIRKVDLFIVSLLQSKMKIHSYENVRTLSEFYYSYCEEELNSLCGSYEEEQLAKISGLVFKNTLLKQKITHEEIGGNPGINLYFKHDTLRDFLLGHFLKEKFVSIQEKIISGTPLKESDLNDFDFVYPTEVNRFCKEIINDELMQELTFDVIEYLFQKVEVSAQTFFCYILGRFSSEPIRNQAKEFLTKIKDDRYANLKKKFNSKELLLIRTIFISLAFLGDESASVEYINKLVTNKEWEDLNRGFHLAYYGDFDLYTGHKKFMLNEDILEIDFPQTFSALMTRLERSLLEAKEPNKKYHNLFEIELFTICSLAQHRNIEKKLKPHIKERAINLIDDVLEQQKLKSSDLENYLFMIKVNLKDDAFKLGKFIEKLYNLKMQKRTGWDKDKSSNKLAAQNVSIDLNIGDIVYPESIAAHVYGAYLLALIFLPEKKPQNDVEYEDYDKEKILQMVLVHDLAEAYVGDKISGEKTGVDREDEEKWFGYIGMMETYKGISGLYSARKLFEEFEHEKTINSKIAKEIDRLDNLLQLFIYKKKGYTIASFNSWKNELIHKIKTSEGKTIKDVILDYF